MEQSTMRWRREIWDQLRKAKSMSLQHNVNSLGKEKTLPRQHLLLQFL